MGIEFNTDVVLKGITKRKKEKVELKFNRGYTYGLKKVVYRRNKKIADIYFHDHPDYPFSYILCEDVPSNVFETSGNTEIEICEAEDD